MYEDPIKRYVDECNAALGLDDASQRLNRGLELITRTADIILDRLRVTPPPRSSAVRQIYIAQELVKSEPEVLALFDMSSGPVSPQHVLPNLYRDAYWLKKAAAMAPLGTLPADAPYKGLDHLLSALLDDAHQIVAACPPLVPRKMSPYWALASVTSGDYAVIELKQFEDAVAEAIWAAAREPGPVEDWTPPTFISSGGDLTDVLLAEDCESYLFSEKFRAAVEAGRQPQDNHSWLAVAVELTDGRSRDYWLLNLGAPDGADTWGLVPELVAERTVVLNGGGDSDPAWSERARDQVRQACPQIRFDRVDR